MSMKFIADYSAAEQHALRNEVCPDFSDPQVDYFLRVCHAKNIDPFSGLLYAQKRRNTKTGKDKIGVSPTIDGSRAAASRTGFYAGSDEPIFDAETEKNPKWCKVTVYRMVKGEKCAYTAKCRWEEFKPSPPNDFQWNSKPYHMLAKVTEMQALRKAFPELVSGAGEDDYEEETEQTEQLPKKDPTISIEWQKAVQAFFSLKKTEADLLDYLKVAKEDVTSDHIEMLRSWYEELTRD